MKLLHPLEGVPSFLMKRQDGRIDISSVRICHVVPIYISERLVRMGPRSQAPRASATMTESRNDFVDYAWMEARGRPPVHDDLLPWTYS